MLTEYFEVVLDSWNAVQFVVQQQTGGPQSYAISKWLIQVTVQFFHDNRDLEPDEVADFLSTIMNQELNTLIEDGSDLEVSTILCRIYELNRAGNTQAIQEILSQIRQSKSQVYNMKVDSDEEGMETCQEVGSQMSPVGLSTSTHAAAESQALPPKFLSSEGQQQEQDELNGWTVIQKGKKKNR